MSCLTHEIQWTGCAHVGRMYDVQGVLPSSMWCWEKGLPLLHRGWPVLFQPPACTPLQEPLRIWEGPAQKEIEKSCLHWRVHISEVAFNPGDSWMLVPFVFRVRFIELGKLTSCWVVKKVERVERFMHIIHLIWSVLNSSCISNK